MNSKELLHALRTCPVTRPFYRGVYPADVAIARHKHHRQYAPCMIIINTDNDGQEGEHWLVFFYQTKDHLDVFDPLGQAPYTYPNLTDFFNSHSIGCIMFNSRQVQSLISNLCGAHCLFYCCKRCEVKDGRMKSMKTIISKYYSTNVDYNDCMVLNYINKKFPIGSTTIKGLYNTTYKCKLA